MVLEKLDFQISWMGGLSFTKTAQILTTCGRKHLVKGSFSDSDSDSKSDESDDEGDPGHILDRTEYI